MLLFKVQKGLPCWRSIYMVVLFENVYYSQGCLGKTGDRRVSCSKPKSKQLDGEIDASVLGALSALLEDLVPST